MHSQVFLFTTGEESHVYVGQATDKKKREKQKGPECREFDRVADWSGQVMRALNGFGNDTIAYKDMPPHRRLLVDSCEVSTTCDVLIMVCESHNGHPMDK